MGVGFWQGKLNDEGQIDFDVVKHLKLHLPKLQLADGEWANGGGGVKGWTDYDVRLPELANDEFDQGGHYPNQTSRFVTDFEAAEVFSKAGAGHGKYWYDIVAKKGEQLNYMGELEGNEGNVGYLAIDVMQQQFQDPKRCVGEPPKSRCGNPELVGNGSTANEFGPWCNLSDAVDGCNDMKTKIFTGAGDPAPRFDEGQRVKTIEVDEHGKPVDDETDPEDETTTECVQYVDELFMLSDKLVKCIKASGGTVPEFDNCEALYYGYKGYIKLKDEIQEDAGFFTCGMPVGNVDRNFPLTDENGPIVGLEGDELWDFCYCEDDCGAITDIYPVIDIVTMQRDFSYTNKALCEMPKDVPDDKGNYGYGGVWKCDNFGAPELDLCDTTWHDLEEYGRADNPNKYCGLTPDGDAGGSESEDMSRVVSCTACDDLICQEGKPFDAPIDSLEGYVSCKGGDGGNGVHCCSFLVPNPFYDPFAEGMDTPFPHPRIPTSSCLETQEYCDTYGYLGGMPHVPYEHGYIWHTVLGWHPDMAMARGRTEYRYNCDHQQVTFEGNEDNMVFDCCTGQAPDFLSELRSCEICCPCTPCATTIKKIYVYPKVTVEPAPTPTVYLL
jgi:hypothetical protein